MAGDKTYVTDNNDKLHRATRTKGVTPSDIVWSSNPNDYTVQVLVDGKWHRAVLTYDVQAASFFDNINIDKALIVGDDGKSHTALIIDPTSSDVNMSPIPTDDHSTLAGTTTGETALNVYSEEWASVQWQDNVNVYKVLVQGSDGKTHTALLTTSVIGEVEAIVKGTSPLEILDAIADSLIYLKAYGDCETRNLPEGYQELEYIEGNSANQYINTGIVPTSSMEYYAKCAVLDRIANSFPVFGARASNGGNDGIGAFVGSGSNTRIDSFFFTASGTEYRWQLDNVNTRGDIYEITFKNALQEVVKNGSSIGTKQYTPTTTCDKPLYVGSLNNGGTLQAGEWTYRFYRFTITGIADMRPARRLSDGALGMYDTIRKQFYTNAGTGSFIAGAALTLPEGYTRIEYIEGNNNTQYIDTGIVPTSSMSMYFKGQFVSVDASTPNQVSFLAGARDVGGQYGFFLQLAPTNVGLDWFVVNGRWTENNTRAVSDVVEMKVNNSLAEIFINGASVGTHQYTPNDTTQYPLFLNGLNSVGRPFDTNVNAVNRIYRFTIDGVADFVPARRDSDGAIGMFNVLNNQFYGNAGTGTFTAGNIISPSPTAPQDIWCNNGAIKAIRPLEYLQSTGTQYIDTGVVPNQDTSVELDGSIDGYGIFFGVRTAASVGISTIQGTFAGYWAMGYNTSADSFGTKDSNRHVWFKNKNLQYMDGELKNNYTYANFTAMGNAYLFAYNNNGTVGYFTGRVKIYSCKIWDGNTLVRYFIPALDANNIPCLYDKVEGKCYYNAGTGQFIAPYLPADYEQVEYIQNSGTQYIDTGIVPSSSSSIDIKFQTQPTSGYSTVCGARNATFGGVNVSLSSTNFVVDWFGTANTDRWSDLTISSNKIYDFSAYNSVATVSLDDSVIGTHTFTPVSGGATTQQMYLFGMNNNGVLSISSNTIKIYRFTVAGVCDMIPVKKISTGEYGMYDLIRQQFFGNAGTGSFTCDADYTELEYIESTGTQAINTGVKYSGNDFTTEWIGEDMGGTGTLFACAPETPYSAGLYTSFPTQNVRVCYIGTSNALDIGYTKGTGSFYTWKFESQNHTINTYRDGVAIKTGVAWSGDVPTDKNIYLFCGGISNNTLGQFSKLRLKRWKLTQNGSVVFNGIAAKRKSDNAIGMYDTVSKTFFTNAGTGTFTAGAEKPVTPVAIPYTVDGTVEKVKIDTGADVATCENLFGIGSSQDVQEILTGEVTRKVGVLVLNGSETWIDFNNQHQMYQMPIPNTTAPTVATNIVCSHFVSDLGSLANMPNNSGKVGISGLFPSSAVLMIKKTDIGGLSQWMSFLRSQYDAGTPVIVVYPLSADETESVAGQTLTVSAGNNTAEIIQANIDDLELEAKYMKVA